MVLFLNPVFKQTIWGGERLGKDWPYEIPGNDTGECWADDQQRESFHFDKCLRNGESSGEHAVDLSKR